MTARVELTGKQFGRWKVVAYSKTIRGAALWKCICRCGTEREIIGGNLRFGKTLSCGCLQREITSKTKSKNGQSKNILYSCWAGMKDRCSNPGTLCYKDYGGRGIRVCQRWLDDFWNFWDDMAPGWRPGLSIDRINVNGNYEPGNCRWADQKQQMRNTRVTQFIETAQGKMTIAEAAEKSGLSVTAIKYRIFSNWPIESLLERSTTRRWAKRPIPNY